MLHPHTARFGVAVSGQRRGAPNGEQDDFSRRMGKRLVGGLMPIGGGGEPTSVLERMRDTRKEIYEHLTAIQQAADGEERDLTDDEWKEIREARTKLDGPEGLDARIDELAQLEERKLKATEADRSGEPRKERKVESVTEQRTYRKGGPHQFFADAFNANRGDPSAQARQTKHIEECRVEGELEVRDVGTSAFGALVVPHHLTEEFAAVLRNGRAFANAVRGLPLPPDGMVLKIPRGQTGSSVAPQATQNTAVSETDVDFDNDVTIDVRTFAGQQDVSRQALERGTLSDELLYADLVADYAERLDDSIINDDGTAGTHKGIRSATGVNAVTYTDATPTVPEFWAKLADAVQQVASNRKLGANLIVMHPRRWGWIISARDTTDRPLVIHGNASDAVNAMGQAAADFGEGQLVGTLQGIPVLVDGNIPTTVGAGTEDVIAVVRRSDPILWEEGGGLPRRLRFEDVGSATLTVKLLVYGYSAFTAERYPKGISIISGTGLIAPTF